jgi:hypothetical protein
VETQPLELEWTCGEASSWRRIWCYLPNVSWSIYHHHYCPHWKEKQVSSSAIAYGISCCPSSLSHFPYK